MKNNTNTVEEGNEYVTKAYLKEAVTEIVDAAFDKFAEKLAPVFTAIDERFDRIESTMATKEDLKRFATKEDIANMATKKDLIQIHDNFVSRNEYMNNNNNA
ncbi:MAG: hypothetical protein ABIO57_02710 [Candidatus Paceibacterota bacterium]